MASGGSGSPNPGAYGWGGGYMPSPAEGDCSSLRLQPPRQGRATRWLVPESRAICALSGLLRWRGSPQFRPQSPPATSASTTVITSDPHPTRATAQGADWLHEASRRETEGRLLPLQSSSAPWNTPSALSPPPNTSALCRPPPQ